MSSTVSNVTFRRPESVAVIGAGMVGLATAWFLQEHGVEVTVLERTGVAAGSSWGNAGWLTPGISTPLPEPSVLRYGIKAVLSPSSPVYVPPTASPGLLSFLARFTRNCTTKRWDRAMNGLVPINRRSLDAFAVLDDVLVGTKTLEAKPFIAAYRTEKERESLLAELKNIHRFGQEIDFEVLTGTAARELEPALSDQIEAAIVLHGQRFIDPGAYVHALAESVIARGGKVIEGADVDRVVDLGDGVEVAGTRYDNAVIATGTWFGHLAKPYGVRTKVQAGRGYSFSIRMEHMPTAPVYFPVQRVACTPLGDRFRVAGMMEFRAPDAALDPRRIKAIAEATRPLLTGVDLDQREDEWVGSRPCTPDGLPLIGATRSPRVYAAGGHSMWGITLGPATGQLLAEQMTTGTVPAELVPLDPLR